ncbi:MAG: rhodanese-like domain-containing protein [Candidatus Marinimicrobia bacterium]|jgi:rhodanese-related sulfurtransferase|nr:rhodanese-like domain-containing protein [Candidatus Neomarinimicrobiota bacterium]MBT3840305.1 rhodanese-like domain-containing protein [Candidatus Neomarinimicrobiota bacterium]MBT4000303.1 rhodanese-like domain-containing protein [Candidatus Neomarinimicrobiota bacterium]MBT4382607.1 rhodanese-like domain-containing protein [Candidatus Neomarinimicrobiota bacterium]MBT4578510.1 rhodanese-like domain-containing protein [Candidatus Neomarinimicrobiota bacterium]
MKSITVLKLKQRMDNNESFTLLDVREERELALASINEAIHMPMMAIPYQLDEIGKDKPVYLICHTGLRSAQACLYLERKGFDVANVVGGINAWSLEVDSNTPVY